MCIVCKLPSSCPTHPFSPSPAAVPPEQAVEVAGALAYLHAHGVLHGDLTGNNVLLHASTKDRRMFEAMVGPPHCQTAVK